MDPSSILGSFTGVVAVAMIFGLPIVAVVGAFVIAIVASQKKHRERMKMIEQGLVPPERHRRTGNFYVLLILGAILFAFGLALTCAELASRGGDLQGGFIFAFVGLALLVCFVVVRVLRRKEPSATAGPTDPKP